MLVGTRTHNVLASEMNRTGCEHYDRCGATGHYLTPRGVVRCECLQLEMNRKALGSMYCVDPATNTKLSQLTDDNLTIEGPLTSVKRQVARVLLDLASSDTTYLTMDIYRLIEIFLKQDEDLETLFATIEPGLLVLLLGFADPKNRYLPELVLQTISRRTMLGKATWVILGIERDAIAGRYSRELADELKGFRKAVIK